MFNTQINYLSKSGPHKTLNKGYFGCSLQVLGLNPCKLLLVHTHTHTRTQICTNALLAVHLNELSIQEAFSLSLSHTHTHKHTPCTHTHTPIAVHVYELGVQEALSHTPTHTQTPTPTHVHRHTHAHARTARRSCVWTQCTKGWSFWPCKARPWSALCLRHHKGAPPVMSKSSHTHTHTHTPRVSTVSRPVYNTHTCSTICINIRTYTQTHIHTHMLNDLHKHTHTRTHSVQYTQLQVPTVPTVHLGRQSAGWAQRARATTQVGHRAILLRLGTESKSYHLIW